MSEQERIEQGKKCLIALASAWRGDWFDFDGRTLAAQLSNVREVLDGKLSYDDFLSMVGIAKDTFDWV